MIDKDVTIERLGFVRELLRIGGFNSKIKANHVKTIDDTIALLKEQEPVEVKDCADIVDGIQVGYCPKCDRKIVWNPEKEEAVAFCKYCGQAVKWNGGVYR